MFVKEFCGCSERCAGVTVNCPPIPVFLMFSVHRSTHVLKFGVCCYFTPEMMYWREMSVRFLITFQEKIALPLRYPFFQKSRAVC